jgi:hypothetical protein
MDEEQIRQIIKSIPRQLWRFGGNPPHLSLSLDDMDIAVHPDSSSRDIDLCKTVVVTVLWKNGKSAAFIYNRADVL